jgi:hypothetical protein
VVLSKFLIADPRVVRELRTARVPHLPMRVRDGTGLVGALVIRESPPTRRGELGSQRQPDALVDYFLSAEALCYAHLGKDFAIGTKVALTRTAEPYLP